MATAAAAAAASIAIQCKASFRGEDRIMVVGGRAVEGSCCPLNRRRPFCSVAVKRPPTRAVLAISPAPRTVGSMVSSVSVCTDPFAPPSRFVNIGDDDSPCRRGTHLQQLGKDEGSGGREPVSPEKLDEWMRESVSEIVRNIGEAPFLVHVFSSNEGPAGLRLEREPAGAENWPRIRGSWSTGAALPPDGVILVEELREVGELEHGKRGESARSRDQDEDAASWSGGGGGASSSSSSSSKTWGVLVQGRGSDIGGAACYILNTCRVRSSFGFCTHFCLARAKCFGDTADVQLRKAWLLLGTREHQHQHQHQHQY